MEIRTYQLSDEKKWLNCLMLSYFNSDYYDQLVNMRPRYENVTIELVATEKDSIIGILDIEVEKHPGHFTSSDKEISGEITYLGVIPEFRKNGIAKKLLEKGKEILKNDFDVTRIEITIRESVFLKTFLKKTGFSPIADSKYYQVYFVEDFFTRLEIDFPFEFMVDIISGFVSEEIFEQLRTSIPPERTIPHLSYEYRKREKD